MTREQKLENAIRTFMQADSASKAWKAYFFHILLEDELENEMAFEREMDQRQYDHDVWADETFG